MVTLRYLHSQQEGEARRARLEEARRVAKLIGVQRARMYAAQKREQAVCVMEHLRTQWLQEKQRERALVDCMLHEAHERRGEGMKSAAELEAKQEEQAVKELSAWEAERALERERHRLALAKASVTKTLEAEPRRRILERKKFVRVAEEARAKAVVAKREKHSIPRFTGCPSAGSFVLSGAGRPTSSRHLRGVGTRTHSSHPIASIDWPANAERNEGADVTATHYIEERRRALELAQETVEQKRREAAERAAALRRKKEEEAKREEEQKRRREESLLLLRRHAADESRKEDVCSRMQDTRRSIALTAMERSEFEEEFLHGKLSVRDKLKQKRDPVSYKTFEELLQESTISSLLPTDADIVARLPTTSLCVFPEGGRGVYCERVPRCDAAVGENGNDMPQKDGCMVESPYRPPALSLEHSLPPRPLRASEEVPSRPKCDDDGSPSGDDCSCDHTSTNSGTEDAAAMKRYHGQFTANLKLLQARLERAMENMSPLDTPRDSPTHANVTVSTMSSVSTPSRRVGTTDDDLPTGDYKSTTIGGTSSGSIESHDGSSTSTSSTLKRTHPTMSAEQLKAALLRMKLRLRSGQ